MFRVIAICAGLVALSAISVQAFPLSSANGGRTDVAVAPHVEPIVEWVSAAPGSRVPGAPSVRTGFPAAQRACTDPSQSQC
jgi:hypothetical protein